MARLGPDLDKAGIAPLMPTVPEDQRAPAPAAKSSPGQGSTGACDACRLRKVRCLANESSLSSKCQRCARANRECVYTTHSKTRRRKRTDTRVKELEEKVRGLSMLLESGKGGSATSSAERDIGGAAEEEGSMKDTQNFMTAPSPETGEMCSWQKMTGHSEVYDPGSVMHDWGQSIGNLDSDSMAPDVVDRGLLSMVKATELFNRYINRLMPQYPAFPLSGTADELRRDKPILFLAVLAASVEATDPILNLKLNQEIQQLYAKKIAVQGYKSLELIQALCVSTLWTYPPKKFEELKFHQQIHMAATMALDIGLGKRSRGPIYTNLDPVENQDAAGHITLARHFRSSENTTLEGRRALLACYINCTSVSMSLRLPNMLRFTSWMAECLETLENSPEAAPTDKRFAAWVRLQHIVEDSFISLGLDNPDDTISLEEERAQVLLKGAEKQLAAWKKQADSEPGVMNDFLEITYHTNNVYLHEIALHPDYDTEDFRPPFSITMKAASRRRLSPPYINAIMVCISASQSLIGTFLDIDIEDARASPTLVFVRVIYAVVILMKLSISASAPASGLGKVLDPEDCKVMYYAERLLAHLDTVAFFQDGKKHVLAFKFRHILSNLKAWFHKQTLHLGAQNEQVQLKGFYNTAHLSQDGVRTAPADPVDIPQAMPSEYGHPTETNNLSQYPPASAADTNFLFESDRSLIGRAFDADADAAQASQALSFNKGIAKLYDGAEAVQSSPDFQEPVDYSFPVAGNGLFEFPMEVDPNLFSQLVSSDLYENSGGNVLLNGENGMEYTDMPDVDWTNWSMQ